MDRRGFMGAILALGAAPAIVRADSLMRIVSRNLLLDTRGEGLIGLNIIHGDGIHDDTAGLQAFFDGKGVIDARTGLPIMGTLTGGQYLLSETILLRGESNRAVSGCHFIGQNMDYKPMFYVPDSLGSLPIAFSRIESRT